MEQTEKALAAGTAPVHTEFKLPQIHELKVETGVTEAAVPARATRSTPVAFKAFLEQRLADLKQLVSREKKHPTKDSKDSQWNDKQPMQVIHFVGKPAQLKGLTSLYNQMEVLETKLKSLRGGKVVDASLSALIPAQGGG